MKLFGEDLEKQINAIIENAENKETLAQIRFLADLTAVFFMQLITQGLSRAEAMTLTTEYLVAIGSSGPRS